MDFLRKRRPVGRFFLWFCAAKPRCFLGGNGLQGAAAAALFCLTAAGGFEVYLSCTRSQVVFLFAGFNGRPSQFEAT